MKVKTRRLAWLLACLSASLLARASDVAPAPKPVFVHVVPWYASKPVSGAWGWHWTMGHFDPDRRDSDGSPQIASHDGPLIGPYDSSDPDLLDYHVQLMKLAGVDGAIVDWYGLAEFRDYRLVHRNTDRLRAALERAGLGFAVCYEDQSVKHRAGAQGLKPDEAVAEGKEVVDWLGREWFSRPSYLRIDGRPALLVFGPQFFTRPQWETILSGRQPRPLFLGLPHVAETSGTDGSFGWPPVSGGRTVTPEESRKSLGELDTRAAKAPCIAVAFPGFQDIYQEAGVRPSYGRIEDRDGATLSETLDLALASPARVVQVATWNDHGEGTVVEPTRRAGYRRLEILQERIRAKVKSDLAFSSANLRLPAQLYERRKATPPDAVEARKVLDRASEALFAGHCEEARQLLMTSP